MYFSSEHLDDAAQGATTTWRAVKDDFEASYFCSTALFDLPTGVAITKDGSPVESAAIALEPGTTAVLSAQCEAAVQSPVLSPAHSAVTWTLPSDDANFSFVRNGDGTVSVTAASNAQAQASASVSASNGMGQSRSVSVSVASPLAPPQEGQTCTVDGVSYRVLPGAAGVEVLSADVSQVAADLVLPSSVAIGTSSLPVVAVAANANLAASSSVTVPASVATLGDASFGGACEVYFLGECPAKGAASSWENVFSATQGALYFPNAKYRANGPWGDFVFEAGVLAGFDTKGFNYPESVSMVYGATGEAVPAQVSLRPGRTYDLGAVQHAFVSPDGSDWSVDYRAFHTAVSWSTTRPDIAQVSVGRDGRASLSLGAAAKVGDTFTVTASNAIGETASVEVSVLDASSATDLSACTVSPSAIPAQYVGFTEKPNVALHYCGSALQEGTDYTISCRMPDGVVTHDFSVLPLSSPHAPYTLVIEGAGMFAGVLEMPFEVRDSLTMGDWSYILDESGNAVITSYDASRAAGGVAVVPAHVGQDGSVEVAGIAAQAISGSLDKLVVPDTVDMLDANALSSLSSCASVTFLGSCPRIAGGQAALPAGASVSAFSDVDKAAFDAAFGASNVSLMQDGWSYHLDLSGDPAAPSARGSVVSAQGPAYHGAFGRTVGLEIPSSIDGVSIVEIGARAFASTGTLDVAALMVPACIESLGEDAFASLDGIVMFYGDCPKAPAAGVGIDPAYPLDIRFAEGTAGWTDQANTWCTVDAVRDAFDGSWKLRVIPTGEGARWNWSIAGYAGAGGDLAIPSRICGAFVTSLSAGAIADGSAITKLIVPSSIQRIETGAVTGVAGPVLFEGEPPDGVDYRTEFQDASGATATNLMTYSREYAAQWESSPWVTTGAYQFDRYYECEAANYAYTQALDSTGAPIEGSYLIDGYVGEASEIKLPSALDGVSATLDGQPAVLTGRVVGVADYAFDAFKKPVDLQAVVIPESVESIGEGAFRFNSQLASVEIEGAGLTSIGASAFWYCDALSEIRLPKSVASVADGAFITMSMQRVEVDPANAAYCSVDGVLFSKDMTELCCYPKARPETTYEVPASVKVIRENAMRSDPYAVNHPLQTVVLPQGLETIGDMAFANDCGIRAIDIPDSVTSVGQGAFMLCDALTDAKLSASLSVIPDSLFYSCGTLANVQIKGAPSVIDEHAFSRTGLVSVAIPEGVSLIGSSAFDSCLKLESVTLPSTIDTIGYAAFYEDANLASINLQDTSVRVIGQAAFVHTALTQVEIPNTVEDLGGLNPDPRNSGGSVFSMCYKLQSVTFEEGSRVRTILDGTFYDCSSLKTVVLPASVSAIERHAFYNCHGLAAVDGKIVVLNQGDWRLDLEAFTGLVYDEVTQTELEKLLCMNVYGYSFSSTLPVLSSVAQVAGSPEFYPAHFFPIDVSMVADLPAQVDAVMGSPVELSVAAVSDNGAPLSYQWYRDMIPMEGQTTPTLTFAPDEFGDHTYQVRVYNAYDKAYYAQSAACVVRINPESGLPGEAGELAMSMPSGAEYTGRAQTVSLVVSSNGKQLAAGADYDLVVKDAAGATVSADRLIDAGTYTFEVTGKGAYAGSSSQEFVIAPRHIDKSVCGSLRESYLQTGGSIRIAPTLAMGDAVLQLGRDYDIELFDGEERPIAADELVDTGSYRVLVKGAGNYTGEVSFDFAVEQSPFADVNEEVRQSLPSKTPVWYVDNESLSFVLERGLMKGHDAGEFAGCFRPYDAMTRAQAVLVLYRAAGMPAAPRAEVSFEDVGAQDYYVEALSWALAEGIVTGYEQADGTCPTFGPDDTVTREQLAVMFARYADSQGLYVPVADPQQALAGLGSVDEVSSWALASVAWCYEQGIVTGVPAASGPADLAPSDPALRAQVAKMLTVLLRTAGE